MIYVGTVKLLMSKQAIEMTGTVTMVMVEILHVQWKLIGPALQETLLQPLYARRFVETELLEYLWRTTATMEILLLEMAVMPTVL